MTWEQFMAARQLLAEEKIGSPMREAARTAKAEEDRLAMAEAGVAVRGRP